MDIRVLGIADSAEMVLSNGGPLDLSGGVQALVKAKVGGCGGWVVAWWWTGGWLSNGGPLDLSGGVHALVKAKVGVVGGCGVPGGWVCVVAMLTARRVHGTALDLNGGVQALLKVKVGGHVQVCLHTKHTSPDGDVVWEALGCSGWCMGCCR